MSAGACQCEGYAGIAHDFETTRALLEKREAQLAALFSVGYKSAEFMGDVARELVSARARFPNSWGSMTALTEEVGELAKAMLDESPERIRAEAVQVAVMACRVAIEGDSTLIELRNRKGGPGLQFPEFDEDGERIP